MGAGWKHGPASGKPASGTPARGGPKAGAGWGGGAKGEGKRGGGPGRPSGEAWHGKASVADMMIEAGARELATQRWLEILNDPAHPKHAEMVAKAAERMDGSPVQPVRGEGGPLIVVTGVERAED